MRRCHSSLIHVKTSMKHDYYILLENISIPTLVTDEYGYHQNIIIKFCSNYSSLNFILSQLVLKYEFLIFTVNTKRVFQILSLNKYPRELNGQDNLKNITCLKGKFMNKALPARRVCGEEFQVVCVIMVIMVTMVVMVSMVIMDIKVIVVIITVIIMVIITCRAGVWERISGCLCTKFHPQSGYAGPSDGSRTPEQFYFRFN